MIARVLHRKIVTSAYGRKCLNEQDSFMWTALCSVVAEVVTKKTRLPPGRALKRCARAHTHTHSALLILPFSPQQGDQSLLFV